MSLSMRQKLNVEQTNKDENPVTCKRTTLKAYVCIYSRTPIKRPPIKRATPYLSSQLLKSRNNCQYNTVNKTPFKWPSLLSDRGHLSAVLMSVLCCFYPYLAASKNVIYGFWSYFQQAPTVTAD